MMMSLCLTLIVSIIILYTLFQVSMTVKFKVKDFSIGLWYLIIGLFVIPFAILKPGDQINMWWFSFWTRNLGSKALFGCHMTTKDRHYLEIEEPVVIVSNHQSSLDQFIVMDLWPRSGRCTMMAKRSLLYAGTFGIASLLCGVIFVDRFNPKKARATIDKVVNTIKTRKTKVWMYPEGTRSAGTDKSMLPFKKGAFHIAIKAQVPIIPVVISNYKDCYDPRGHTFEQINVKVCVLPPIPTEGKTVDDVNQLTEDVWEVMLQTYNKISNNN